jgi:hypothetical protein
MTAPDHFDAFPEARGAGRDDPSGSVGYGHAPDVRIGAIPPQLDPATRDAERAASASTAAVRERIRAAVLATLDEQLAKELLP